MNENPEEETTDADIDGHARRIKRFRGDVLDLDPLDRMVRVEPLFMEDEATLEHDGKQIPRLRGMGFHMHSKAIIVDEEGVSEQWSCDYVAMDTAQIFALRNALNTLLYIEGEE